MPIYISSGLKLLLKNTYSGILFPCFANENCLVYCFIDMRRSMTIKFTQGFFADGGNQDSMS